MDYCRFITNLSIDHTMMMPSLDLSYESFSVVGTYNLDPVYFSSQFIPHWNRADNLRLREPQKCPLFVLNTLKTTRKDAYHPDRIYSRPFSLYFHMSSAWSHARWSQPCCPSLPFFRAITRSPCAYLFSFLLLSFLSVTPIRCLSSLRFLMSSVHIFSLLICLNLNPITVQRLKIPTG